MTKEILVEKVKSKLDNMNVTYSMLDISDSEVSFEIDNEYSIPSYITVNDQLNGTVDVSWECSSIEFMNERISGVWDPKEPVEYMVIQMITALQSLNEGLDEVGNLVRRIRQCCRRNNFDHDNVLKLFDEPK